MKHKMSLIVSGLVLASVALVGCGGAEQRLARSLERGQQYLADGNYAKARVEFSNALQIEPNNAEVVYLSGTAAERLGEYRPAAQAYLAALNIDANHALARAAMGRLYLFFGFPANALDFAETGLQSAPDHPDLLTLRAGANVARGETLLARADAERVVREHPEHEQAIGLLAGIYSNAGENERALELLSRALELRPDSIDLRTVAAELHQSAGDVDRAEAELKRIVALDPESPLPRQRLARFYLSLGHEADAEALLRELVELSPDAAEPKLDLVRFRLARESFESAEAELLRFIASNPDDRELDLALGELYQANDNSAAAEAHYRRMADTYAREPAGLQASTRLAAVLFASGRTDEASRIVDDVLEENPRDNDALILHASIESSRGDALAAITDLRAVVRDQPENAALRAALARAFVQHGDAGLAREEYQNAIARDPGNGQLKIEFADFLGRRGETAEAEELLSALLAADPQNLAGIETLFKVQMTAGNLDAARDSAMRAIQYFPEHPLGFYLLGQYHELADSSLDQAIAYYERSLEKEPRAAEPLGALARVLLKTGDRARAKSRVAAVLVEMPANGVALNLMAELHLADREFDAAIRRADEAIAATPGWWVPYRTKALARGGLSDIEGALAAYSEGMAATGGTPALGMDLAVLHERLNQPDDAILIYEQLVAGSPGAEVLANNLAMLLSTYRDDPASIDRAADLIQGFRNSDVPAYLNTYGWVRYKQGNIDEAVSYLQRAVTAAPTQPVMRYHLGMALLKSGDLDRAQAELSAAVAVDEVFPGKEEAAQALAEIERPRG